MLEKIKQAKKEKKLPGSRSSYDLLSDSEKPLIRQMNARLTGVNCVDV